MFVTTVVHLMSPQGRFENTLTGMMEALAEIKGKGDLMMGAIRGQRELLFDVRGEVREAAFAMELCLLCVRGRWGT